MKRVEIHKSMSPGEWVMLIILSILWGGSFFFNGVAVQELPVFTIVVARVTLGAISLLIFMRLMGQSLPGDRVVWQAFLYMGILNNAIPFSFIVWGQLHLASGVASILNAATPLATVLVAHYCTSDEKLTPGRVTGVLIGFLGVAVMIGLDVLGGLETRLLASLALMVAVLSYAFSSVYGRRFREMGVTPMATATGQVCASSLLLFPVMLVMDQPWSLPMPSVEVWGALIGLGILCTAISYFLYFRILQTAGATNITLVTFLVPVSAILLGVGILDETIELKHFFGMAMICIGLACIDGRLWPMLLRLICRNKSGKGSGR